MKRYVILLILLVGCFVAAAWLGRSYLARVVRPIVERQIVRSLGAPSHLEEFSISLVPPGLHVRGIVIGTESPLIQARQLDIQLWLLESLTARRPVLSVTLEAPTIDFSRFSSPGAGAGTKKRTGRRFPPISIKDAEITQAQLRFRMGNVPATVSVARLAAQVKAGIRARSLAATVDITGIEMQRKAYHVRVGEVHADGGADAKGFFVRTASLTGDGITASVRATDVAHKHAAVATFDPGLLGIVVDELSFIGGQAHLEGTLTEDLANPVLDGRLNINQSAIASHTLGDLDTHVTRDGTHFHFDDLRLSGNPGHVNGTVDLTIDKSVPIRADLNWLAVDLEGLLAVIGPSVPLSNIFYATTTVTGGLDPLDLKVEGNGNLQMTGAEAAKEVGGWEISSRIHAHDLQARLDVRQPQQNRVSAVVTLQGPKLENLDGTINLDAADLAALNHILPAPLRPLALTGSAHGQATLGGSTEHPTVAGMVGMQNLTISGYPASRANGDFTIARGQLTTRSVTLETTGGRAELSGSVALTSAAENEWRLNLRDLSTDLTFAVTRAFTGIETPLNGGTLNGTVQCRGPWLRAETQADVVARSLRIAREPLDSLQAKVTTTLPRWTVQGTILRTATQRLTIDAMGESMGRLQVKVDSTPLNLTDFRRLRRQHLAGSIAVHGEVAGELPRLSGSVQLTGTGLRRNDRTLGDAVLRADAHDGEWTIQGGAFADTFQLRGTLGRAAALPYTLDANWRDTNLSDLLTDDSSLQALISGELHLAGSLRAPDKPNGSLQLTRFEITRGTGHIEAPEPIRIDVNEGRCTIRSLVLAAPEARLRVSGGWTFVGELQLDLQGDGDLVLLELGGPPIHAARGPFTMMAHVAHRLDTGWALQGQATVRDLVLDVGLPVEFTDTNADLTLTGSQVRFDRFNGRAGGGEFSLQGSIDLNEGPAVTWTVHETALRMPEWLEERISGNGQVQGTWRQLSVSGDLEVVNALYDRRLELGDLLPWFKEQVAQAPSTAPPTTQVHLDLHIHAPDGLFIDNNFAKAEMRADLRVTGDTRKPMLFGTVEILGGEVTFRNRTFTITGGAIEFQDSYRVNPILNISAEARIPTAEADYTVFVIVSGTADDPRVQFSSDDPGLSQNDVLSLVTIGKTSAQAQRESGGVAVGDVLALLPSEVSGDVGGRVRKLFGVDRFEVEPVYFRDTGSVEPRVSVGKDITDRLRALASTSLGLQAREAVQLEYRVTGRVSLLSSWEGHTQQEAGAFGADVKFRYEFRKLPFSLFSSDEDSAPRGDAR